MGLSEPVARDEHRWALSRRLRLAAWPQSTSIDKDNSTHSTSVGQFLCVTSASSDKKKADVEIFDSEADARAKAADVMGTGTGVGVVACVKKLSQVTRATISNLTTRVDDAMAACNEPVWV